MVQIISVPEGREEPAFLAYSITKTFTSVIVLRLCEEGLLDLDAPIARWFPNVDRADRISLRHLLNHTAGIPDYGPLREYHESVRAAPHTPWTFDRFAAETFDWGLLFEPGSSWAYSNPGYMLVVRIAEMVAGEPFRDLVQSRITLPLGLRRTYVAESIADLASLAPASSTALSLDRSPLDVRHHYHPRWVSHRVVASTASEIARFFDALFGGALLSSESLEQMTALVTLDLGEKGAGVGEPARFDESQAGLGVFAEFSRTQGLVFGHGGGGPGYTADVSHSTRRGTTACVMAGIEEGFDAHTLVREALDFIAGTSVTAVGPP
jgi:D-alanyl-D-alanine carboxypeptidase